MFPDVPETESPADTTAKAEPGPPAAAPTFLPAPLCCLAQSWLHSGWQLLLEAQRCHGEELGNIVGFAV